MNITKEILLTENVGGLVHLFMIVTFAGINLSLATDTDELNTSA